jgi:hypothetical protein
VVLKQNATNVYGTASQQAKDLAKGLAKENFTFY